MRERKYQSEVEGRTSSPSRIRPGKGVEERGRRPRQAYHAKRPGVFTGYQCIHTQRDEYVASKYVVYQSFL